MAQLIHINGLPGVGKTSLARQFVESRPMALVVDIDLLRTQLGRWEEDPAVAAERFVDRRAELRTEAAQHPQSDVEDVDIQQVIRDASLALRSVRETRRSIRVVDASGTAERALVHLMAALAQDK